MPFRSSKQRRWAFANKPKMAKSWAEKYGTKPRPKTKPKGKGTSRKKTS